MSEGTVEDYQPMTLADLAGQLDGASGDATRWRLVREFLEEFRHAPSAQRPGLIHGEPPEIGSRWDALVAAVAEHLAFHHDLPCPPWVTRPHRFLRQAWFPNGLPAARAAAMETSPASFRRRCVFIDRRDLGAA